MAYARFSRAEFVCYGAMECRALPQKIVGLRRATIMELKTPSVERI